MFIVSFDQKSLAVAIMEDRFGWIYLIVSFFSDMKVITKVVIFTLFYFSTPKPGNRILMPREALSVRVSTQQLVMPPDTTFEFI